MLPFLSSFFNAIISILVICFSKSPVISYSNEILLNRGIMNELQYNWSGVILHRFVYNPNEIRLVPIALYFWEVFISPRFIKIN